MFESGDTAKEKIAELRENGAEVISFSEEDVKALDRAFRSGQKVPLGNLTAAQRKAINENYHRYKNQEALGKTIDFKKYLEGLSDSPEDKEIARKRGECAQMLITAGYSKLQINMFHPFIMQGKSAEEIMKLFSKDATMEEIENLLNMFG